MALGLLVAPSAAGAALALLAGFFLRRPVKLLLGRTFHIQHESKVVPVTWSRGALAAVDRPYATGASRPQEAPERSGAAEPRRSVALACVAVLGSVMVVGLALAAVLSSLGQLWPLLLAVPAGATFVWFDSRGESREAAAELAGSLAFAAIPAAFATLSGWPPAPALALAAVMAGRSMPTVMTIRTYLRRQKGQTVSAGPALTASAVAVAGTVLLARADLAPQAAAAGMMILLIRAGALLGPLHLRASARKVGVAESVLGGILVAVLALSWIR